ncbi:DUF4062 domain-containing protein [Paenibacillus sp. NPDC056579]|uniref:DUF4062 domain-containing protein n=1 Tax=Paenibacillus sp. NPDC056579 TaxID=3345871 RepID=UPI0036C0A533
MSSVGQDDLRPIRNAVFEELSAMGHAPLMYERNFGPWDSHRDSVVRCLEKVEQSDIFLLFIKDKGGTFYPDYDRTITHLEYMQAARLNKTILVFVETSVKNAFFGTVKPILEDITNRHVERTGGYPKAADVTAALKGHHQIPPYVDPYVWFLIDDLVKKGVYFEDLSLGVAINWRDYFSDLLRRGVLLLPLEMTFEAYIKQIQIYEEFQLFIDLSIPVFQQLPIQNTASLFRIFMNHLKGGVIRHRYGNLFSEDIGTFADCSAITVYGRSDDKMTLAFQLGATTSEPHFQIDDDQSYVSITAKRDSQEQLFFKEGKKTLYLTVKCRDRVMTCHFRADSSWDSKKFVTFRDDILYAIMNQNPMIFEFARKLIGGMQL